MPFSFSIHPLLPLDYIETLAIADAAFARLNSLLFTTYPPSSESQSKLTNARLRALATMPQASMFKAVDDRTGKIVGAARWTVAAEDEDIEQSVEEAVEEIMTRAIPETNEACTRGFYNMAGNGRREILGIRDESGEVVKLTRRVELETLFTRPGYQGGGVANALLQWGVEEARRLGVVVYLEATAEGRPVYKRLGFEAVKVVDFDAEVFGGAGTHRYTVSLAPGPGIDMDVLTGQFMLRRPSEGVVV